MLLLLLLSLFYFLLLFSMSPHSFHLGNSDIFLEFTIQSSAAVQNSNSQTEMQIYEINNTAGLTSRYSRGLIKL